MPRSRRQTRERLSYSSDKEEQLMRDFGLDYEVGSDGKDYVPVPELMSELMQEACHWCDMGEHEEALAVFEDALAVVNHYSGGPLGPQGIYWLRAKCCFEMENYEKVIQDCTQVINFDKYGILPPTAECYGLKTVAYLRQGQTDLALRTAYDFYIHCPWNPEAEWMIGEIRRGIESKRQKAKELADEFIQKEERQTKGRKVICRPTPAKPKLVKRKRKKTEQVRTTGTGKREVAKEVVKCAASSDESYTSSTDSCTSDAGHKEVKEEEDPDEGLWTTVRKKQPVITHNRFEIPPASSPAPAVVKRKHTATTAKRNLAARQSPFSHPATSTRHSSEFPPMMLGKSPTQRKAHVQQQSCKSPKQPTTQTKRHRKPGRNEDASTQVKPAGLTIVDFIKNQTSSRPAQDLHVRGAEASPAKTMSFPTCLEDINSGITTVREGYCYYCQLQCNSQQQLQQHYQGKRHRAKLLSDDSNQMWQYRRPPPGVPGGQYKMCPNRFGRCIHGRLCTYAHTEEELSEWQERYEIRKQKLQKAKTSGRYGCSLGETLAEEYSKAKDKTKVLSTTVKHTSLSVEPKDTSVTFPERGREYTWTFKLQTKLPVKTVAFLECNCSQFKIKSVTSTSGQLVDGLLSEDGQEWTSHSGQQSSSTGFIVKVTFYSKQYGSFNQAVIFDVGQRPCLFCPLHVDVAMVTDLDDLTKLRDKFSLLGSSWEEHGKVVHYIEEPDTDGDVGEELRVKYHLPSSPENLLNLKIFKEDQLNKFNYKQRQHRLLFIEEAEQMEHIRRLTLQTTGVVSDVLEKTLADSSHVEFAQGGERFIRIYLNEPLSDDSPQGYLLTRSLSPKAHVIIYTESTDQEVYEVWVEWKTKNSIWLRIPSSVCQHFSLEHDTEVNMEVQFKLDRSPMLFRHCAVDAMKDPMLVFPEDPNVSKRFWKNLRKESPSPPHALNDKQKEAFAKITAPTERPIPPVLLIGPFGTGKTHTLAAAASAAAQQPGSRVLICTHSNSAADLYIRKFLRTEDFSGNRSSLLRIYYKRRKKETVPGDVLQYCIMSEDGSYRYPTREEVATTKIVITTLSLSLVLTREVGLEPGFFTHIMVDEAAQALECDAITPLSLATANTRVVLAGDHMQLSPKVFSSFAREKSFHQSLLERLFYHYQQWVPDEDTLHPCITLLHENYRCHNEILKFPSKVFYGGKLLCRSEAKKHPNFFPLMFYAAYGQDSTEDTTTSFYNDAEVWEVAYRVKAFWDSWPEEEWGEKDNESMAQIGVITPYQDQVNRIRLALRRQHLAHVTVETVTNVQGKEYRALFLSTVRTRTTCCSEHLNSSHESHGNESADFGFLSDSKLLNTAITRAKSFVGVVGDPISLCSVGSCRKIWLEYIEDCEKHRSLHGAMVEEIKQILNMLEMGAFSLPVATVLRPEAPIFVPQRQSIQQSTSKAHSREQGEEDSNQARQLPSPRKGIPKAPSSKEVYTPTCSAYIPVASTTAALSNLSTEDKVTGGNLRQEDGLKKYVPQHQLEDSLMEAMGSLEIQARRNPQTDLISSALQRQISKAESNAEDGVGDSTSSDSDEIPDIQLHEGAAEDAVDSKPKLCHVETFQSKVSNINEATSYHAGGSADSTEDKTTFETQVVSPASAEPFKQTEPTAGSDDTSSFIDDKDEIVKELQKQVRRAEDPNYTRDEEYKDEYPSPREALGADEPNERRTMYRLADGKNAQGERDAQKGRMKPTALFKLGSSIAATSERVGLSIEGYSARYTYEGRDEESERTRGGKHYYQKHFDENTMYEVLQRQPNKYVKCRIQMSKSLSGQGFGVMEETTAKDIQLNSLKRLNRAFDGDEVVVELEPEGHKEASCMKGYTPIDGQTEREGRVIGILRPAVPHEDLQFVCYVDNNDPNVLIPVKKGAPKFQNVVPQDLEDPVDFIQLYNITPDGRLKFRQKVPYHRAAKKRHLFVIRFLKWEPHFVYPLGVATRMLEPGDSQDHAVKVLLADHMIEGTFPQQVLGHVNGIDPEANDSYLFRYDLTSLTAITIDPPGACDLDDALSVRQLKNGKYKIWVHIADVSNFVKKGDAVDLEALARGTSYYPHTAEVAMVPMLPPELCTNLLSLLPQGEKYAVTVSVEIDDKTGEISKPRFFPSKIKLKTQLTYKQAQNILNGETDAEEPVDRDVELSIQRLGRIAKTLRTNRLGDLAFLPSDVDEDRMSSEAHHLVEEFMIMANRLVAQHVRKHFPQCTLLRRQLLPKEHRITEWIEAHGNATEQSLLLSSEMSNLKTFAHIPDKEDSEDQQFLEMRVIIIREIIWTQICSATEDGDLQKLQMLVLFDNKHPQLASAKGHYRRIQNRAMYVSSGQYPDNPDMYSHFSLNIPVYTHFTSPIRRYADIVVHRLLSATMTGSTCPYEQAELEEICAHLTQKAWNSKSFDKRVSLIKMAFEIQKKPTVQQPFIEDIDGRRIRLEFPDCPQLPANNRTISMAHLQPDQQPSWGEGTVTFVWRPRIYDMFKFNQEDQAQERSFLPDDKAIKPCTYTKRISSTTWKAMVDAVRQNDIVSLKKVVNTASKNEVQNDMEQQRLLEMSRADSKSTTAAIPRGQRTQGEEEDHEDVLRDEEDGHTAVGLDSNDVHDSTIGEVRKYNRTIEVTYSHYDVIQVQLTTDMYRGLLTPTIQLLKLTPAVDICLEHRCNPVKVFATHTGEMASRERYESLEQYIQLWRPVLEMEAAYGGSNQKEAVTILGVKIQWKKKRGQIQGTLIVPGQFARSCCFLIRPGDQLCVRYDNLASTSDTVNKDESGHTATEDSDGSSSTDSLDPTCSDVEEVDGKEGPTWVAHCIVDDVKPRPVRLKESVDKYKITIRLHHHSADAPKCILDPAFCARRSCTVEHIPLPLPIRRMRAAVVGLKESSSECAILEEICINKHPERIQRIDQGLHARSKDLCLDTLHQGLARLNVYQTRAVEKALCCPFYVIQGPPGTGKTVTGAHLAFKFAQRNKNAGSGDVIMYCGPSNKSVDVVAEWLMNSGLKILRVYSKRIEQADYPVPNYPRSSQSTRSNDRLRAITLHHVIRQPGSPLGQQLLTMEGMFQTKKLLHEPITDREVDIYLNLIDKASTERIKGADILLCTCNMACDKKFISVPVKQCIIDEAAMCMEPESLIPLSSFALEQVVLIGDHQQLQPIVGQPDARDLGLGVSLFQRHADKAYMLEIQYRMHENICEFPSHKFYDSKLKTAESVKRRPPDLVPSNFWPSPGKPVVFCHVEGVEEFLPVASAEGGVMSQSNQEEVHKVVRIVHDLVLRHHVKTAKIAVLSPYRAQVHQITECLKEKNLDMVSVRTIVESQGSEWDYVVLSTVRSLPQTEIPAQPSRRWLKDQLGFLTDDHQINVGLTRARRGFIIVGNKNLLSTYSTWSDLVQFYQERGYLVNSTQFP